MTNLDNIKREAMIEMLIALDAALDNRINQWAKEARSIRQAVLNPREAKTNKARVLECKIRIDEIQGIRNFVMGTIETCREQNAQSLDDKDNVR